jgi:hypothetical protein
VENDEHSADDKEDEEDVEDDADDDNDEQQDEETDVSSVPPVPNEMTKLSHIIDSNHLLSPSAMDELDEENKNRSFKPFHDDQKDDDEETNNNDDDVRSTTSTYRRSAGVAIDPNYVRAKVKQTLKKKLKQQHHRLCTKGETAMVTAQRRDQRDTIELHLE